MVGDSHAGSLRSGVQMAVKGKMAFAFMAQSSHYFGMLDPEPRLPQLYEHVGQGDVVLLASRLTLTQRPVYFRGTGSSHPYASDPRVLAHYATGLLPWLRRVGAKLVLLGDNYGLSRDGSLCRPTARTNPCAYSEASILSGFGCGSHQAPNGRCPSPSHNALRQYEAAMQAFADEHHDVVHFFPQLDLWLTPDGQGSNLIPGTRTNGYVDQGHVNRQGSLYLWPFLCDAFERWGFFD